MSQPSIKKRVLTARSEVANATRTQHRDPERLVRARLAFNAIKIEQAIETYPSIADEDRERLAALLLGGE